MKVCQHCCQEKDTECFYKDKRQTDGLGKVCKACKKELDHARYERGKNA